MATKEINQLLMVARRSGTRHPRLCGEEAKRIRGCPYLILEVGKPRKSIASEWCKSTDGFFESPGDLEVEGNITISRKWVAFLASSNMVEYTGLIPRRGSSYGSGEWYDSPSVMDRVRVVRSIRQPVPALNSLFRVRKLDELGDVCPRLEFGLMTLEMNWEERGLASLAPE